MPTKDPKKNASDQRAFKQRMYDSGYKQVQVWVHVDDKADLIAYAKELRRIQEDKNTMVYTDSRLGIVED